MTSGDIDPFLAQQPEVLRDRFGRPLIKQPNGKTKGYTRCTTYVGALEDTYNLQLWTQRMVALGLAQREDLMLAAASLTDRPEDKKALNDICSQAREAAAASSSATKGTALHKMCERLDRGEKFQIPTAAKADIEAYRTATKHLRWQRIETLLVHDELEVAGTPDRIGGPTGTLPRVYDIKTGSIEYGIGKIAMQMAMYANSHAYDITTGERQPLTVDLNVATIIHLPAGEGRCELVDVDIRAGWEGVQLATQVREWRKRKDFTPAPLDLPTLIRQAHDADTLRALWAAHEQQWNDQLTALAKERLAALAA